MDKKVVLITGGNRGLGYSTAELFLKKGFSVIVTARKKEAGENALEKLKGLGDAYFHILDITDHKSVNKTREYVQEKFGKLDILINNAAINYDTWQNVLNADLNEVMETIDTNLMGAWRMIQAFVPMMRNNNFGRIVNVSSGLGLFNEMGSGTPAYSISKGALNALTVKVANTLDGENILINSVCPGWARTDMGGVEAPMSAEESAGRIVWLALNDTFNGKFIRDKEAISF